MSIKKTEQYENENVRSDVSKGMLYVSRKGYFYAPFPKSTGFNPSQISPFRGFDIKWASF
jgi:hypothetical protein